MRLPLTVYVRRQQYTIIRSPDPLVDDDGRRYMAQPDEEQGVIWIDPAVSDDDAPDLLRRVSHYLYRRVPASAG